MLLILFGASALSKSVPLEFEDGGASEYTDSKAEKTVVPRIEARDGKKYYYWPQWNKWKNRKLIVDIDRTSHIGVLSVNLSPMEKRGPAAGLKTRSRKVRFFRKLKSGPRLKHLIRRNTIQKNGWRRQKKQDSDMQYLQPSIMTAMPCGIQIQPFWVFVNALMAATW
jgi:hypothetical protein